MVLGRVHSGAGEDSDPNKCQWQDERELAAHFQLGRRFEPSMDVARREELYTGWKRAVDCAKGWACPPLQ